MPRAPRSPTRPHPARASSGAASSVADELYDEGLAAELPPGQMASHGLPYQSRTLALTPSLLAALFGSRLPAGPATAATLAAAGYVCPGGDWWIPTGRVRYLDPGEALADARGRFLKPLAHIDPFGSETRVAYHKDYFLVLESTRRRGQRRARRGLRLPHPRAPRLRDANDNLSAVVLDELALVTALAFLGKDLDQRRHGRARSGRRAGRAVVRQHRGRRHRRRLPRRERFGADRALARQLLRQATTRFVYDLDRWRLAGAPAVGARITRTRHHSDDPNAPLQLSFEYTDGSGALAMTKTQAEPGLARTAGLNPDGSVTSARLTPACSCRRGCAGSAAAGRCSTTRRTRSGSTSPTSR